MDNLKELYKRILEYYESTKQDVYIYSGPIDRNIHILRELICSHQNKREEASLFIATFGGDPDWAYRLIAILRRYYKKINIIIPGYCKSAGTLVALGADTLRFHEYGELGPLDVQMRRKDNLLGYNSGLDVFQAIQVINMSARECFHNMFIEFLMKGGGPIPTETAAKIAKDLAVGIYSSIASKIDPLELGEKNRAMKIASSYGEKLNSISQNNNMKQDTLNKLISDYPSHGFVIDMQQAKELFKNVENMTEMDYYLFKAFQKNFENPSEVFCLDLESIRNSLEKEEKNVDVCRGGDELSSSNKEGKNRANTKKSK